MDIRGQIKNHDPNHPDNDHDIPQYKSLKRTLQFLQWPRGSHGYVGPRQKSVQKNVELKRCASASSRTPCKESNLAFTVATIARGDFQAI